MNLILTRKEFTETSTIGELTMPMPYFATIEDKDRGLKQELPVAGIKEIKAQGETAIPYGTYEVGTSYSNRFKKLLPILLNVPGFSGIRIHAGNKATDTEGCIIIAMTNPDEPDVVYDSRDAMEIFMAWLQVTLETQKVFITIQKSN